MACAERPQVRSSTAVDDCRTADGRLSGGQPPAGDQGFIRLSMQALRATRSREEIPLARHWACASAKVSVWPIGGTGSVGSGGRVVGTGSVGVGVGDEVGVGSLVGVGEDV